MITKTELKNKNMKIKNTIQDVNRKRGNADRVLETLTNIFFKDKFTGVIRMYNRKMQLVDESHQAETNFNNAIKTGNYTWKMK
jgi:hypothetical protein